MTMTFIRAVLGAVVLAATASAVWLPGATLNTCFYDFNYGDILQSCDDCCYDLDDEEIRGFRVPFLGQTYDEVTWENNGEIMFGPTCRNSRCNANTVDHPYDSLEFPFVGDEIPDYVMAIVYSFDQDTADMGGSEYAAVLSDAADLAPIVADVVASGLAAADFNPGWAVIITALMVHTDAEEVGEYVNYQAVIISDGTNTYAIYKFGVLTVPGPETSSSGSCNYEARIGFYDHVNAALFIYKGGEVSGGIGDVGTADPTLMQTESNCGVPGMVVFDVTDATVVEPAAGAMCSGDCGGGTVPSGDCTRCLAGSADQCHAAGFCFDAGTMVADLGCTLACTCQEGGKWDKCKPMKKDSDERKMACLACRADDNEASCNGTAVGTIVFGDSAGCGMAECLLSNNGKVCGDATLPCSAAQVEAKKVVGKLPMIKGKPAWLNWCNAVDPPAAAV